MGMYNPELIYGISLGELDRSSRLNLPEGIVTEDEEGFSEKKVDEEKLEQIVKKQGLQLISDAGDNVGGDEPELENLYVGVGIKEGKTESLYGGGLVIFDVEQICRLRQNPSELIEKMKAIGLNVRKTDFRLYGATWID